jgi:hypothetical protein
MKMKTIQVTVTAEHLKRHDRKSEKDCAVGLAMQDLGYTNPCMDYDWFSITGYASKGSERRISYSNPMVPEFIRQVDSSLDTVKPATFELEVPDV